MTNLTPYTGGLTPYDGNSIAPLSHPSDVAQDEALAQAIELGFDALNIANEMAQAFGSDEFFNDLESLERDLEQLYDSQDDDNFLSEFDLEFH